MKKIVNRLNIWLVWISSVSVLVILVLMFADALLRKIFLPIPGAFETNLGLMVIVFFFPLAAVQMRRGHVNVDLLTSRLGKKWSTLLNVVASLLGIVAFGILAYASLVKAWQSTLDCEFWYGLINYPVWPFRWVMLIGVAMLVMQLFITLIDDFFEWRKQ